MAASQRIKGKNGERELASLLREHLGDSAISRNLQQSRNGGYDLNGPVLERFAVEVKRAAMPKISTWWAQACEQAANRIPVLAYRLDRHDWHFIVPLGALHNGFDAGNYGMTATLGLAEFCTNLASPRLALPLCRQCLSPGGK